MKRTAYLILFRGVGGKTQLPTQALRKKLTGAGFETVATYINSGNAIVGSRMSRKKVIATIAEVCRTQFDFDKAIFAPTLAEWEELIAAIHLPGPRPTRPHRSTPRCSRARRKRRTSNAWAPAQ